MNPSKRGDIVRHPGKSEWGRGLVVDVKGDRVCVFFENVAGNKAIKLDVGKVKLDHVQGERVPLLEFLRYRYIGNDVILDEARASFQDLFQHFIKECPGGFKDEKLLRQELSFKRSAREAFLQRFGEGRAQRLLEEGNFAELTRGYGEVLDRQEILLAPKFERTPFYGAMTVPENVLGFTKGLLEYLEKDPNEASFDRYVAALERVKPTGPLRVTTWPLLTLFPFLARPDKDMFLKPDLTREAANRVGVDLAYEPRLNWTTYDRTRHLANTVDAELEKRGMRPRDHIETQSFLWVAISYPVTAV